MDSDSSNESVTPTTPIGNVGMQKLIPIVNRMQDVCTQMGTSLQLDLPQIAVVGSQSAGKSSVLENIVGRDFLPRGSGIVTRRPLVLQLINGKQEFGQFQHCKEKLFTNFEDIRKEIASETERTTGMNKGVSSIPINLCIQSPNVLNLTLIDLPGVIKNQMEGQPADIVQQVRDMILEYIRKENCLILAVSAANVDLATSDALNLAREVDEEGTRTIGVITKLDIMDEGTDARDIFENKLFPLRRGYVGVVNRSQKEIDGRKDIPAALESERNFFRRHPYYRTISDRLGTLYLQKVLNQQLTDHIRVTLPALQDTLRKQMVVLEKNVNNFKHSHPEDPEVMKEVMLKVLQKLGEDFKKQIGSLGSQTLDTNKLTSGALIRQIFHERLPIEISKDEYNYSNNQREIRRTILNLYGIDVGLYPPMKAFEVIVGMQIRKLAAPVKTCVDLVIQELSNAVRTCTQVITDYPSFRDTVENKIMSFIHRNGLLYQDNILSLIEMESAYMNTKHDEFVRYTRTPPVDIKRDNKPGASKNFAKVEENIEVIREGQLHITNIEIEDGKDGQSSDPCWFILSNKTLACFKINDLNKSVFKLPVKGLRMRQEHSKKSDPVIILFSANGQNLYQDHKVIELLCENPAEISLWADSFTKAFNFKENLKSQENQPTVDEVITDKMGISDEDVLDIYHKINTYMNIVKTTIRDMVPKAITLYIIRHLETYISTDLLMEILNVPEETYKEMFAADPENTAKYQETQKMHKTCEAALKEIIHI